MTSLDHAVEYDGGVCRHHRFSNFAFRCRAVGARRAVPIDGVQKITRSRTDCRDSLELFPVGTVMGNYIFIAGRDSRHWRACCIGESAVRNSNLTAIALVRSVCSDFGSQFQDFIFISKSKHSEQAFSALNDSAVCRIPAALMADAEFRPYLGWV